MVEILASNNLSITITPEHPSWLSKIMSSKRAHGQHNALPSNKKISGGQRLSAQKRLLLCSGRNIFASVARHCETNQTQNPYIHRGHMCFYFVIITTQQALHQGRGGHPQAHLVYHYQYHQHFEIYLSGLLLLGISLGLEPLTS